MSESCPASAGAPATRPVRQHRDGLIALMARVLDLYTARLKPARAR